jgi:hypothetical protein
MCLALSAFEESTRQYQREILDAVEGQGLGFSCASFYQGVLPLVPRFQGEEGGFGPGIHGSLKRAALTEAWCRPSHKFVQDAPSVVSCRCSAE